MDWTGCEGLTTFIETGEKNMGEENMIQQMRFFVTTLILPVAACAFIAGDASAQNPEKFVISGEAAKRALTKVEISGDIAEKIAQACLDHAKQNNRTVSVFILSPSGEIVHAHRMDGQGPVNIDTALMKAETALYMRDSTHALANQAEAIGNLARQVRLYKLGQYPVEGGLPIVVDGQLIGAVGVGGAGGFDEDCAYHALVKVLGPQPPLAPRLPAPRQFAPTPPPQEQPR